MHRLAAILFVFISLLFSLLAQPVHAQIPVASAMDLIEDAPKPPIKVINLAVGTGVNKRKLTGQSEVFIARGQRLWAHVIVANSGAPTHITMVWRHEEQVRWRIDLRVGESPSWRTWSRYTMVPKRDVGDWEVEVFDGAGRSLGVVQFKVRLPETRRAEAPPVVFEEFGC